MEAIFLNPVFKHNIWGGTGLREKYGYEVEGDDIGECWGIAAHQNGDCEVKNGSFAGMHLSELWKNHPELFGKNGDYTENHVFPLLIKIIDAKSDLSIQVHPDDAYAAEHENGSLGKTECWYILDCPDDACLVIGHNAGTREELESMIREGRWNEFIRTVPVRKGDFIQINPGTVHAIKGGIMLLETQQNSDITYRVYDYDRLSNGKPRQLHVQQSIDVIAVPAEDSEKCVSHTEGMADNQLNELYSCKYYHVYCLSVNGRADIPAQQGYLLATVVEGEGTLNGVAVNKGDHFILPCGYGDIHLEGSMQLICSSEGSSEAGQDSDK